MNMNFYNLRSKSSFFIREKVAVTLIYNYLVVSVMANYQHHQLEMLGHTPITMTHTHTHDVENIPISAGVCWMKT